MKYELQNLIQGKGGDGKTNTISTIASYAKKQVVTTKETSTQSNYGTLMSVSTQRKKRGQ